jgi:hypothetical protein
MMLTYRPVRLIEKHADCPASDSVTALGYALCFQAIGSYRPKD